MGIRLESETTAMQPRSIATLLVLAACIGLAASSSSSAASPPSPAASSASSPPANPSPSPPSSGSSGTTISGAGTVTQVVTLNIAASQYTGNTKTLMESAYGYVLGIYTSAGWATDCSVTSSAARRTSSVTFVATVSSTKSAAAQTNANAMTVNILTSAVSSAATLLGSAYTALVSTITVTGVQSPSFAAATTSGVAKLSLSLAALGVVALALRH